MHRGRRSRLAQPYQPGRGLGLKHPSRRRGKGSTRQSLREPASEQSLGSPGSRPGARTIFHGEGYQEGYAEGSHVGVIEGRRYGALHGAKIGSEELFSSEDWRFRKLSDRKLGIRIKTVMKLKVAAISFNIINS
ncbi:protein LTO1 homolog isoform X4 [Chrysemys picta bellii]|uniref:protein LTO1 homolog isoform X4 n=1 Tax=Chrysemys picta bellii TaxID=8478 RepID=UPI0032B17A8C